MYMTDIDDSRMASRLYTSTERKQQRRTLSNVPPSSVDRTCSYNSTYICTRIVQPYRLEPITRVCANIAEPLYVIMRSSMGCCWPCALKAPFNRKHEGQTHALTETDAESRASLKFYCFRAMRAHKAHTHTAWISREKLIKALHYSANELLVWFILRASLGSRSFFFFICGDKLGFEVMLGYNIFDLVGSTKNTGEFTWSRFI